MADHDREPVSAKLEPVPDSTDLLGQEHQRRKKRLIAGFAVGGVAIVVGVAALLVVQDRAAKARLHGSAADLSACLFGDAVPAGASVAKMLRGSQLTAMGLPDGERAPAEGQPWPQRCGIVAQNLMEAAKDAGLADKSDDADLVDRADAFAKALKTPTAQYADLGALADGTWSALEKAKVVVEASKKVPPGPPPRSKPLGPAELGDSSAISKTPFVFGSVELSSYRGETFHILVQDAGVPNAPFLCAFDEGPIRCRTIPGELGQGKLALKIFGSTEKGAWPLLLAGENGQGGLYRSEDGVKIADGPLLGASIAKDGVVRVLRQKGRDAQVEVMHPGEARAKITKYPLPEGCATLSVGMLWDEAVVECQIPWDRAQNKGDHIFLPLGKEVPGFKKPERIETTDADEAEMAAVGEPPPIPGASYATCRAGETKIVGRGQTMFFKDALGWSRPPKSTMRGGQVSCTDKVATVTYLADARGETPWRSSITHTRCTVAECTATTMQFETLLKGGLEGAPRAKLFDATSAGDAMIVAWASGQTGGVRVRIGAADGIVASTDVVVYDDLGADGPLAGKPDLTDMTVIGQPKQATLLLRTSRGVHAVRIASDGGFFPGEVVWEGAAKK